MGDDLYSKDDFENIAKQKDSAMLVKKLRSGFTGGKVIFDNDKRLLSIKEGKHKNSGFVNAALYKLPKSFFDTEMAKLDENSKEYGLPQTLVKYAKSNPVNIVESKAWRQIADIDDLIRAEKQLVKENRSNGRSNLSYFK